MSDTLVIDGDAQANPLARDRALHYGDGVFETMVKHGDAVRHWGRHMQRLVRGCRALGIEPPQETVLHAQCEALAAPAPCVIKLIVSRGEGRRGYAPDPEARPRCLWRVEALPADVTGRDDNGLTVAWLGTTLARQPALAGIKHLNRLEQVLAARELAALDADEGLVCDARGEVIEAVSANVFLVRDGRLATPALAHCGVAGVMREAVLEAAGELGIDVAVTSLRRADFAFAEEVFLTNSVRGVMPVTKVGEVVYTRHDTAAALRERVTGEAGA